MPFDVVLLETVTCWKEAVPHCCDFPPADVTFHAIGIGVICESSLYVYQFEFALEFSLNVSVLPLVVIEARSSGIVPAA